MVHADHRRRTRRRRQSNSTSATSNCGEDTSSGTVTAWEPPIRFAYEEHGWSGEAPPVATEVTVTSRSGDRCVVRMVHSLFTDKDDWDDELESFETGWPGFFEVLRLYLQELRRRAGRDRARDGSRSRRRRRSLVEADLRAEPDRRQRRRPPRNHRRCTALAGTVERVHQDANSRDADGAARRTRRRRRGDRQLSRWARNHAAMASIFFYGDRRRRHRGGGTAEMVDVAAWLVRRRARSPPDDGLRAPTCWSCSARQRCICRAPASQPNTTPWFAPSVGNATQVISVVGVGGSSAKVDVFERTAAGWQPIGVGIPAFVGANGMAPQTHDGEMKTPMGDLHPGLRVRHRTESRRRPAVRPGRTGPLVGRRHEEPDLQHHAGVQEGRSARSTPIPPAAPRISRSRSTCTRS